VVSGWFQVISGWFQVVSGWFQVISGNIWLFRKWILPGQRPYDASQL
jgi:hypothetical protein